MKKILCAIIFLHVSMFADTFILNQFRANVFSKAEKKPVEIEISLMFEGTEMVVNEYKVVDALNVVIGSYYAEDLVTSRGKELLKSTLISYAEKAHQLTIDAIYIKDLIIKTNTSVKEIIDALKKEVLFQQNTAARQQQSQQQQQQSHQQTPNFLAPPPTSQKIPLPGQNGINF